MMFRFLTVCSIVLLPMATLAEPVTRATQSFSASVSQQRAVAMPLKSSTYYSKQQAVPVVPEPEPEPKTPESFADLEVAILVARENCAGIGTELDSLHKKATVGTIISGVGTVAGGGALYTGIQKSKKDVEAEAYAVAIAMLDAQKNGTDKIDHVFIGDQKAFEQEARKYMEQWNVKFSKLNPQEKAKLMDDQIKDAKKKQSESEQKSKNLGNWRTGLLAGNTVANISGTIMAAGTKVNDDLAARVGACKGAAIALRPKIQQARIDGMDAGTINYAQKISDECGKFDESKLEGINTKSTITMIASGAGAVAGGTGTVMSYMANTDKARKHTDETGVKKEKNLNSGANIAAGAAAGLSGIALILNATQINALKKTANMAKDCEEAL